MKKQPEQQTIPGLPKPDRRKELRNTIEFHRKEADAAKKDMKDAAIDMAELAADAIRLMRDAPAAVKKYAEDFCKARKAFLDQTRAAGLAVEKLTEEEARVALEELKEANR